VLRPRASVVIPAWNGWPLTRACLQALRPTLAPDDEVLVVDNGSEDATAAGLTDFGWVRVVSHATNLGFARGCNSGAAMATGEVVVFLNNDTIPVGGWLTELVTPFVDPAVAATGSRSNFVSGPQLVPNVPYRADRLPELAMFERSWRSATTGQTTETHRLVGFCLAVRRRAFDEIGGFDEGFAIGSYEDDDLCARLREAGGRLLIAHGSFVHHVGHQTFETNGLDWLAVQLDHERHYRDKNGAHVTACVTDDGDAGAVAATVASLGGVVDDVLVGSPANPDGLLAGCRDGWVLWLAPGDELVGTAGVSWLALADRGLPDVLHLAIDDVGPTGALVHAERGARLFRVGMARWDADAGRPVGVPPGRAEPAAHLDGLSLRRPALDPLVRAATPGEADVAAEALWVRRPGDGRVLEQGVRLALHLSLDRVIVWAKRARAAGSASPCPLRARATAPAVAARQRVLAAATAIAVFGDDLSGPLVDALAALGPDDEHGLLAEVEAIAPGLLTDAG